MPQFNVLSIFLLICSLLILSPVATAQFEERLVLNFQIDQPTQWVQGWSRQDETGYMLEFVPKGQTVENWQEMVTLQFYPGLQSKTTPANFRDFFLSRLKGQAPSVKTNLISESADEVIFEWRIDNAANGQSAQHELDRIVRGNQGIHMIHYVAKVSELNSASRQKWLNFLRSSKIINSNNGGK